MSNLTPSLLDQLERRLKEATGADAKPPKFLDEKGRCCGRKPLTYKREGKLFCCRCNAAFHIKTGVQIENWAYEAQGIGFVPSKLVRDADAALRSSLVKGEG